MYRNLWTTYQGSDNAFYFSSNLRDQVRLGEIPSFSAVAPISSGWTNTVFFQNRADFLTFKQQLNKCP
jgi:hypothetical protein